jgi:lysophospholipase L1-like esterase
MTYALGIHGGKLSEQLNTLYKSTPGHQHIVIDNYAIGSKNILYLKTELTTSKTDSGETLNPVTSTHPDLILIESFGYNPLSQLGISNGLKKQTETLSDTMNFITAKLPHTAVMFVATIAPNKETYAENEQPGSSITDREQQAQERTQYIQNHIAYANAHNIPLIDIYDKSLTSDGDGNPIYIEPSDHIHPSFEGIDFISNEIANNIYASQILPK